MSRTRLGEDDPVSSPVSDFGPTTYGEPCGLCDFTWSISFEVAMALVAEVPDGYRRAVAGADGSERTASLGWSVGAYVCHVADNLRIWAERLMGVVGGGGASVASYDENLLAQARRYAAIPLTAALWSLDRSVDDWLAAVDASDPEGVVLVHPERGGLTLFDVTAANAHDAFHHLVDIDTILKSNPGPR